MLLNNKLKINLIWPKKIKNFKLLKIKKHHIKIQNRKILNMVKKILEMNKPLQLK